MTPITLIGLNWSLSILLIIKIKMPCSTTFHPIINRLRTIIDINYSGIKNRMILIVIQYTTESIAKWFKVQSTKNPID